MTIESSLRPAYSMRDPSGFVFSKEGVLYRRVNFSYQEHYDFLRSSGLFDSLVSGGLLIPHEESNEAERLSPGAFKVLKPEKIPFVSYPYEWSFSALKDAALLLLSIQEKALSKGMVLKDAAAVNVQFRKGKPIWIDTLSFEIYKEKEPWIAYQQFCRSFLAPLALGSLRDLRLPAITQVFAEGLPLDLTSRLLPPRSWLRTGLLFHLHAHTGAGRAGKEMKEEKRFMGGVDRAGLLRILDHLRSTIDTLTPRMPRAFWRSYQPEDHYGKEGMQAKVQAVEALLKRSGAGNVWDLGANIGFFSKIASVGADTVVSVDSDPEVTEIHYQDLRRSGNLKILPLVIDLQNPSSGQGWEGEERKSFLERGPADLVLALGLIHHLALGDGIPLERIASFLSRAGKQLIVEFVPKTDIKARAMLARRGDLFADYNAEGFEKKFEVFFSIIERVTVGETDRTIYLMSRR